MKFEVLCHLLVKAASRLTEAGHVAEADQLMTALRVMMIGDLPARMDEVAVTRLAIVEDEGAEQ